MNKEFANIRDWFVENKLSTYFGEDKTKCILSIRCKNLPELNKTFESNRIKQYRIVEYVGCGIDTNLSGESKVKECLRKININLQSSYRQNEFLNPKLRRLLCNSLIQLYFDCTCIFLVPFD